MGAPRSWGSFWKFQVFRIQNGGERRRPQAWLMFGVTDSGFLCKGESSDARGSLQSDVEGGWARHGWPPVPSVLPGTLRGRVKSKVALGPHGLGRLHMHTRTRSACTSLKVIARYYGWGRAASPSDNHDER